MVAPAPQRLNAVRHGLLSRFAVLPWESRDDYDALRLALAGEHGPVGPTEEHLVEELAGIMWRKRRLRLAEIAAYRHELRRNAVFHTEAMTGAALLPLTGRAAARSDLGQALTPAATACGLSDWATEQQEPRTMRGAKE